MDLLSPTITHSANLVGNIPSHSCNSISPLHSSDWVIDSGASDHMNSLSSSFETSHEVRNASPIKLPTSEVIPIIDIGSVKLSPTVTLTNVLYVPDFQFNLLSIRKITHALNCVTIFFSTLCVFQDLSTWKLIGMGEVRDGLYYYKALASPSAMHSQHSLDFSLWHQCLGHPSPSVMNKIIHIPSSCSHCDVCQWAKQVCLPFSLNSNKSTASFNRLYCDIWGGYSTPSHTGAHYFLTIVDDYPCNTWVYLMCLKSETYSCQKHYVFSSRINFLA